MQHCSSQQQTLNKKSLAWLFLSCPNNHLPRMKGPRNQSGGSPS